MARRKSSIIRYASVGSALALIAGFVWYRGTGGIPFAPRSQPATSDTATGPSSAGEVGATEPTDALLPGSKDLVPLLPPPEQGEKKQTIFGGSKSAAIFIPGADPEQSQSGHADEPAAAPESEPPAETEEEETIFGGSKSGPVFP
jgi:hypothetical protein